MRQFLLFITVFSIGSGAFAKTVQFRHCQDYLIPEKATDFDFVLSDLEGLYLEVVEQVAALVETPQSRQAAAMEKLLKTKAEFLNRFTHFSRVLRQDQKNKYREKVRFPQWAEMVTSLGVSPQSFGFAMDEMGQITLPLFPVKNPIGFVQFEEKEEEEDLSPRNSIGFAPMKVVEDEVPLRRGGSLQFFPAPGADFVAVGDFEKQKIYKVSMTLLSANHAETAEKAMTLKFDSDQGEWIVAFENRANPSGQIGFLPAKTEE
jgi:hypothetical protein